MYNVKIYIIYVYKYVYNLTRVMFTWVISLSWLMTPVTSFITWLNKGKMAVSVTTVWMFMYFELVWLKL